MSLGVGRAYWRERGTGGGRSKSYDGEKAWPSANHSILSVCAPMAVARAESVAEVYATPSCLLDVGELAFRFV